MYANNVTNIRQKTIDLEKQPQKQRTLLQIRFMLPNLQNEKSFY